MKVKFLIILLALTFGWNATGGELVVSWNANSETDLAGYKVYWGVQSGNYTNVLNVGNVTERIITEYNFLDSTEYFFAITAYDTAGNESGYSPEASVLIEFAEEPDTTPPDPPGGCSAIWRK